MENFINLLKKLESDDTIQPKDILDFKIPLVEEISREAELLLITIRGHCDWQAIEELGYAGYHVFPLERDSHGWLMGGISTSKGVIAYG